VYTYRIPWCGLGWWLWARPPHAVTWRSDVYDRQCRDWGLSAGACWQGAIWWRARCDVASSRYSKAHTTRGCQWPRHLGGPSSAEWHWLIVRRPASCSADRELQRNSAIVKNERRLFERCRQCDNILPVLSLMQTPRLFWNRVFIMLVDFDIKLRCFWGCRLYIFSFSLRSAKTMSICRSICLSSVFQNFDLGLETMVSALASALSIWTRPGLGLSALSLLRP